MPFASHLEPSRNKRRIEKGDKITAFLRIMLDFGPYVGLKAAAGFPSLPQLCTELRHPVTDGEVWSAGPCPTPMQDHSQEGPSGAAPLRDRTGSQGLPPGFFPRTLANESSPLLIHRKPLFSSRSLSGVIVLSSFFLAFPFLPPVLIPVLFTFFLLHHESCPPLFS